jgi:hypothetical protein
MTVHLLLGDWVVIGLLLTLADDQVDVLRLLATCRTRTRDVICQRWRRHVSELHQASNFRQRTFPVMIRWDGEVLTMMRYRRIRWLGWRPSAEQELEFMEAVDDMWARLHFRNDPRPRWGEEDPREGYLGRG